METERTEGFTTRDLLARDAICRASTIGKPGTSRGSMPTVHLPLFGANQQHLVESRRLRNTNHFMALGW